MAKRGMSGRGTDFELEVEDRGHLLADVADEVGSQGETGEKAEKL